MSQSPQTRAGVGPRGEEVKVLYILGAPRCGSTVLDNILNEVDGFFSAGELRFLWQRLNQGRHCGCGKSFEMCEVWSQVIHQVRASVPSLDPREAMERQQSIAGTRRTWQLLRQLRKGTVPTPTRDHGELTSHLFRAVASVTGARVVVDSSKRPWDGALLGMLDSISPFYLHFIRDPRAMAYSQSKAKPNPDREAVATMAPTTVAESALQWVRRNLSADAVRRAHPARSLLIDYHAFCTDPLGVVRSVTSFVEEPDVDLPFVDDHTVRLGGNHTVSGNPDRFRTGLVPIREDNRWKNDMSKRDKALVTLLTGPLMLRYSRATKRDGASLGQRTTSATGTR